MADNDGLYSLEERIEALKDAETKLHMRRWDVENELSLLPPPHPDIAATLKERIESLRDGERKLQERRWDLEAKLRGEN